MCNWLIPIAPFTLSPFFSDFGFGAKLLNSAANKSNFIVALFTQGLECDSLVMYGDQTEPTVGTLNGHFDGCFKELQFVSQMVDGEMYQCKYKSVMDDPWPYAYVKILCKSTDNVGLWELKFDA